MVPANSIRPATTRNDARQPMNATDQASGAVAISVPSVPTPSWMPTRVPNFSGE